MPWPVKITEARPLRPDLNLGEMRLAAEAALAFQRGEQIPSFVQFRMETVLRNLAGVD
jgi:hypothetical protein